MKITFNASGDNPAVQLTHQDLSIFTYDAMKHLTQSKNIVSDKMDIPAKDILSFEITEYKGNSKLFSITTFKMPGKKQPQSHVAIINSRIIDCERGLSKSRYYLKSYVDKVIHLSDKYG